MGFNNDGAVAIQKRLEAWKAQQVQDAAGKFIVGGNIGKNKITLNEDAWKDYETCFKTLFDVVDYFVVNVSSPNTPGLRELQEKDALKKILSHLQDLNKGFSKQKPLLLKIAPDLSASQLDDIISLAFEIDLDGIVATNTTIGRNDLLTPASAIETIGAGGLSGKPLQQRSTQVLQYLVNSFENKIPVIASGGIFDGADAKEKLLAGASLVQVWTGFIYEGPAIAKEINQSLLQ
jgi:dihydroorotate dehydrogenase